MSYGTKNGTKRGILFGNRKKQAYRQFLDVLNQRDAANAGQLVELGIFIALLPMQTRFIEFYEFWKEMDGGLRALFSDCWQDVELTRVVVSRDELTATRRMKVTFDGLPDDPRYMYLEPTGNQIVIEATDRVTFNRQGRMVRWVVESDLARTVERMFA